jgi:hypothetical protein
VGGDREIVEIVAAVVVGEARELPLVGRREIEGGLGVE